MQNTNPMKHKVDVLKYVVFVNHTCSFTSMITLVFHVWQSYLFFANVYDAFTTIYKHFTHCTHIGS